MCSTTDVKGISCFATIGTHSKDMAVALPMKASSKDKCFKHFKWFVGVKAKNPDIIVKSDNAGDIVEAVHDPGAWLRSKGNSHFAAGSSHNKRDRKALSPHSNLKNDTQRFAVGRWAESAVFDLENLLHMPISIWL